MKYIRLIVVGCLVFVGVAFATPAQAETVAPLTAQEVALLRALLERYSLTQGNTGASSATTVVAPTPTAAPKPVAAKPIARPCHRFDLDLGYGDGGGTSKETLAKEPEVRILQDVLEYLGYDVDNREQKAGSVFQESTASAVVKFQAKQGISQTGYVGPATRAAINKLFNADNCSTGEGNEYPVAKPLPNPSTLPGVKLNKVPEKKVLGVGDKLYWGWTTVNYPKNVNGTDYISMFLVPTDGSEKIQWAMNYWVFDPNQPQYTNISEQTVLRSKIVGKDFKIRIECQSNNEISKTCVDESKETYRINPITATAVSAPVVASEVPRAAPTAITAVTAPVDVVYATIITPAKGTVLYKGGRYTFTSRSEGDLKDVVLTFKNKSTGQVVKTVNAKIVAAQSTFDWTIPTSFPNGEYSLEVLAAGKRITVVNNTFRVMEKIVPPPEGNATSQGNSNVGSVWEAFKSFFIQ